MASENEKMVAGQLYIASDPELIAIRKRARRVVHLFNTRDPDASAKRSKVLAALVDVPSKDCYFEAPTRMDYGVNIHLGKNFYANYDSIFLDEAPITIGDNVMFGPRVSVLTAGHPVVADIRNEGLEYGHLITIGSNVWVGGSATICPGVTIGDNVVVGAGAVVTKDVPSNVVVAGVPAKVLRPIGEADRATWEAAKAAYWAQKD